MRFIETSSRAIKKFVKFFLKKDSKLWNFLSYFSNLLENRFRTDDIYTIIDSFSKSKKVVFFIQIGANDGVFGDPIHDFIIRDKWSGVLVEPLKHIFDSLVENYKGQEKLIFENVAISDKDEIRDFWYLKKIDSQTPEWYEKLGSFQKEVVLKNSEIIPNIEDYLSKKQVKCTTLDTLIAKHNIKKIDAFVIDTEGYDFQIVKQIDFDRFTPSIILYEDRHLREDDKYECKKHLRKMGYKLIRKNCNTIAFK